MTAGPVDVGRLTQAIPALVTKTPGDLLASPSEGSPTGTTSPPKVNGSAPHDGRSVGERLAQKRQQRGQGQAQGRQDTGQQELESDSQKPATGIAGILVDPLNLSLDLIYELTNNLKSYQANRDSGAVDLTMYNYSTMVKTALERIQSQIPNRCGIAPIIAACLDWGIKGLGQYPAVQRLLQLKLTFNERRGKESSSSTEAKGRSGKSLYGARGLMLSNVFHSFPLSFSGSTRNVKIPSDIHSDFNEVLVTGLGLSASNAAMLAITYTLADVAAEERGKELDVPLIIEDDAAEMKSQIDKFLDDAQVRCELIEAGMRRWGMLGEE